MRRLFNLVPASTSRRCGAARAPQADHRALAGKGAWSRPRAAHPMGRAGGFTLLEVLVALVIVGTALGASLRAVGSLSANSNGLRTALMATWSAENHLVQVRLARQFPAVGKRSIECPQGDHQFICQEEVLASPNPRLRRVEISVYDVERPEQRIIKLVQLVLNE